MQEQNISWGVQADGLKPTSTQVVNNEISLNVCDPGDENICDSCA